VGRYTVDLVEYDPGWPLRYEAARAELVQALGNELVVDVHHIGSTSVPGMIAKPTIDIALVVWSIEAFIANVDAVVALGYEYRPAAKFHDEHLFLRRIEGGERTHHLHVVSATCRDLDDWIEFRDVLRRSSDAVRRYSESKCALAAQHYSDRGAYVDGKTPIVEKLLAEAREGRL